MTWFKVDDKFAFHSKALAAGNEALGVWVRAGAWSSGELTDGAIPAHVAATLGPADVWARLVAARLVDVTETGYQMHDFGDYNPSAATVRAEREADKVRKALGRARQSRGTDGRMVSTPPSDRNPPGRPAGHQPESDPPSAGPVPSRPVPIPEQQQRAGAREGDPESDRARVLRYLRAHRSLRPIAEVGVAERVVEKRVGNPKPWPLVEQAIADLASKVADAEALGSPWSSDRMISALHGFIARAQPHEAAAPSAPPRSGPRPYAPPEPVRTGTKVLTFDDPPRPAGGPLPRLREALRPVPNPAPAAPFVPPPGALDALLDGIGNGGRA